VYNRKEVRMPRQEPRANTTATCQTPLLAFEAETCIALNSRYPNLTFPAPCRGSDQGYRLGRNCTQLPVVSRWPGCVEMVGGGTRAGPQPAGPRGSVHLQTTYYAAWHGAIPQNVRAGDPKVSSPRPASGKPLLACFPPIPTPCSRGVIVTARKTRATLRTLQPRIMRSMGLKL
jgi:hypothetical protein